MPETVPLVRARRKFRSELATRSLPEVGSGAAYGGISHVKSGLGQTGIGSYQTFLP